MISWRLFATVHENPLEIHLRSTRFSAVFLSLTWVNLSYDLDAETSFFGRGDRELGFDKISKISPRSAVQRVSIQ